MKKIFSLLFAAFLIHSASIAQVKAVSDVSLINASDKTEISLSSFSAKKGIVVIFTSNYCPFSKLYEDRINDLANKYSSQGIQMVLINSNSPDDNPAESIEEMAAKVSSSSYTFPYLSDNDFYKTLNNKVFRRDTVDCLRSVFKLLHWDKRYLWKWIAKY